MGRYEYERTYTIAVGAPVHEVFEHCRDPRNMFAGNPRIHVDDVTMNPDGVGTIAQVRNETMPVTEYVTHEFTEFVPDQRIVITTRMKMLKRELKERVNWTWMFATEDGGTRLTVDFHESNVPWIEHLLEGLGEKSWARTVNGWLAHIKAQVEAESSATE